MAEFVDIGDAHLFVEGRQVFSAMIPELGKEERDGQPRPPGVPTFLGWSRQVLQCNSQHLQIFGAGNFLRAEAGEVVGVDLAVDPRDAIVEHAAGEGRPP